LAKSALDEAKAFQKENIFGLFKGKTGLGKPSIGTKISGVANEDLLNLISRGNITELQDMKKVLPQETMQIVKRAWLTDLFTRIKPMEIQTPDGKVDVINIPRVVREFERYGEPYLKTLFSPKEMKILGEFTKLGKNIGFAQKIAANPSGTAQTLHMLQIITGTGVTGYGAFRRDPTTAAIGLILTFGSPYAIAKFMTSPAGYRYMTTGIEKSPVIRDILKQAIKSAAIVGTHANIDLNRQKEMTPPKDDQLKYNAVQRKIDLGLIPDKKVNKEVQKLSLEDITGGKR
jgi:hypothetical protein